MLSVENMSDAPPTPVTLPSVHPLSRVAHVLLRCWGVLCAAQGAHSPGALLKLLQEQLDWKQVYFGRRVCEQHMSFESVAF